MDCSPPGSSILGFPRQVYWTELPSPPVSNGYVDEDPSNNNIYVTVTVNAP